MRTVSRAHHASLPKTIDLDTWRPEAGNRYYGVLSQPEPSVPRKRLEIYVPHRDILAEIPKLVSRTRSPRAHPATQMRSDVPAASSVGLDTSSWNRDVGRDCRHVRPPLRPDKLGG